VETATDGTLRYFEIGPGFGPAGVQFFERFFHKVQGGCGCVRLEVGASAVTFDGVTPLRNLPLELDFGKRHGLRQIYFYALAGGLDVADINDPGERRGPETRNWPASSVERKMIPGALIEPARRHHPCVFAAKIALLWSRYRRLIPWMILIDRIPQRVGSDEGLGILPFVVIRTAQKNANVQIAFKDRKS